MSNSANERGARKGKWYKFNDETVLEVQPREAIDNCFGQTVPKIKTLAEVRSLSSAYMLVYIKESMAGEVMREVGPGDVPEDLRRRLDAEKAQQWLDDKTRAHNRQFVHVRYYHDGDVAAFHQYGKQEDLTSMKKLRMLSHSPLLGLLLAIAEEMGLPPQRLQLWRSGKFKPTKITSGTRAFDFHNAEELVTQCIDADGIYYVRQFNAPEDPAVSARWEAKMACLWIGVVWGTLRHATTS